MTSIGVITGTLSVIDQFTGPLKQFEIGIGNAGRQWDKLGGQLTDIGTKMTAGITVPLAAIGGLAIKAASDFESSFAGVRKTVDATEAELAVLRQGIRDMAKEGPTSANDLNKIAEAAGQLGIEKTAILDFTKTVSDLAVTTDLTADSAGNALARIANITGLAQDEFDNLGSAIVALGNAGASTESEIVEMALRIAGAGEIAGLTEAQILGIGSALSSVGVEAEAGGTAIQKVLIGMTKAVSTGGEELEQFAKAAGMTAEQFAGAWEADAGDAFASFVEGLAAQGDRAFQTLDDLGLKDQRLIRSFISLAGAGDLLRESIANGTKAFAENNALTKEAEQRYATFESQLQTFWNQLKDVGITLGESLLPTLRDGLTALKPWIETLASMAEAFAKLPQPVRTAALGIGAVAAAAGPAMVALGLLAQGFGGAATAASVFTKAITAQGTVAALGAWKAAIVSPGGLLVAIGLIAIAANNAVTKWKKSLDEGTQATIAAANKMGDDFAKLKARMQTVGPGNLVSQGDYDAAAKRFKELLNQAVAARQAFADFNAKVQHEIADGGTTPAQLVKLQELRGAMSSANVEVETHGKLWSDIDRIVFPTIDGMNTGLDTTVDTAADVAAGLQTVADKIKAIHEASQKAQQALVANTPTDAELAGELIEGVDMTHLLTPLGEFSVLWKDTFDERILATIVAQSKELTAEIGRVEAATEPIGVDLQAWVDSLGLGESPAQRLREEFEAIKKHLTGVLGLTEATVDEIDRAIKLMRMDEIADKWIRAATMLADAFSTAFGDAGKKIAGFIDQAIQLYEQFRATRGLDGIEGAAAGASFGAAAGGLVNKNYSQELGALGGAIGGFFGFGAWGAAIGTVLGAIINKGADEALAAFKVETGRLVADISGDNSELRDQMSGVSGQIIDSINGFLEGLGSSLQSAEFSIRIRDGEINVWVAGLEAEFTKIEDAINFTIAQVLSNATLLGLSEEVATAIKRAGEQAITETKHQWGGVDFSTFETDIKQFQEDLAFITAYDRSSKSNLQAGLDDLSKAFEDSAKRATRLGLDVARVTEEYERQTAAIKNAAILSFGSDLLSFVDDYYGQIEGGEAFRLQLEQLNFDVRIAQLRLEYAALVAIGALTAEMMANAQAVFDFIDANAPNLTGAPPRVPGAGRERRRERREERRSQIDEAFDVLSTPLTEVRTRTAAWSEAIDFLTTQVNRGHVSAGRLAEAISEFADQATLDFGGSLLSFIDDYYGKTAAGERIRAQLEAINFRVRLETLKLEYEALKRLGLLPAEFVADADAAFAWINDNVPQLGEAIVEALSPAEDFLKRLADAANDPAFSAQSGFLGLIDRILGMLPAGTMVQGFRIQPVGTVTGAFNPGPGQIPADTMDQVVQNAVRPLLVASGQLITVEEARFEIAKAMQLLDLAVIEAQLRAAGVISDTSGQFELDLINSTRTLVEGATFAGEALTAGASAIYDANAAYLETISKVDSLVGKWDSLFGKIDDPVARIKAEAKSISNDFHANLDLAGKLDFLRKIGADVTGVDTLKEANDLFDSIIGDKEAKAIADAIADAFRPITDFLIELRRSGPGLSQTQTFENTLALFNQAIAAGDASAALEFAQLLTGDLGVAQFGAASDLFETLTNDIAAALEGLLPDGPEGDPLAERTATAAEGMAVGIDDFRREAHLDSKALLTEMQEMKRELAALRPLAGARK